MRKIRLIAEAVCLITSMTITPVVTSVEKNDSMVVETVAEASQTPVLKSANDTISRRTVSSIIARTTRRRTLTRCLTAICRM